jgi:hypothetical protein
MATPPVCFGKQWDPKALECSGGLDPMYVNPSDGSSRRDKCSWYSQCAARTCMTTAQPQPTVAAQPPQLVPPGQLVRHPQQPVQPARLQPTVPVQQYPQAMMVPIEQAYYGQQQVPMNHQQGGMQVPGYLTVPEPMQPGVPWYQRLMTEMLRSAFKGLFHTGANFFDHTPFSPPPRPPQQ